METKKKHLPDHKETLDRINDHVFELITEALIQRAEEEMTEWPITYTSTLRPSLAVIEALQKWAAEKKWTVRIHSHADGTGTSFTLL